MKAAFNGHTQVTETLIRLRADVNAKNKVSFFVNCTLLWYTTYKCLILLQ